MKIILMDMREKTILRSKMERRKKLQSIFVEQTDEGNQLLSPISKTWVTSKYEKEALLEQGHQWKQGQWASEEIRVLQANIADYCKLHEIDDPTEIIFNSGKERKDFYRTVAVGLERPLFSVYRRVVRMYDKKNYVGKYTPDELRKLKELQKKYGCDWASIGHAIGRSASSVKDRCRLLKNKYRFGKWEPEEEEKLCEIVYKLSSASPGEDITSGLSWSVVSQHVGSRNEKQCRTKWLNYLNWKQKGGSAWTSNDDKLLLYRLSQLDAKDEVDVDWVKLSQDWPSVRSPQWLRCKWWFMKRKINNYNCLSFKEILSTILSSSRASESDNEYLEIQHNSNLFESDIIIIQPKSTQDHPEEVDLVNFDTAYLTGRFPPSEFSEVDPICNQSLSFPTFDAGTIFQTDGDFMLLEDECENQLISETVVTSMDDWTQE